MTSSRNTPNGSSSGPLELNEELAPASGQDAALFRSIAEAMGEAVIVTSAELDEPGPVIEYVNPGFTRVTGYESHEVIGRTPRVLQGPRTDRAMLARLRATLSAGQSFIGTSINYRKDGTSSSTSG